MYLFYKVVFLAVLFLPWYKGAHYIYRSHLRDIFRAYEEILYDFSLAAIDKIKTEIFTDKPKEQNNMSSDEEEPIESTPDDNESDKDDDCKEAKNDNLKNYKNIENKKIEKNTLKN